MILAGFCFIRNYQTVFQRGHTILCFHQQCRNAGELSTSKSDCVTLAEMSVRLLLLLRSNSNSTTGHSLCLVLAGPQLQDCLLQPTHFGPALHMLFFMKQSLPLPPPSSHHPHPCHPTSSQAKSYRSQLHPFFC